MELEHLPPDEVQASIDQVLRFSLEVITFAKVLRTRHEEPRDFGPEMWCCASKSFRTMNAAVELGYHPTDGIYSEVEKNM
jgi:hypothetical protein